jgi:thiol-disulfide isomerase/thioredoxin
MNKKINFIYFCNIKMSSYLNTNSRTQSVPNPNPITKEQVETYTYDMPYAMVVVYANWCGHCKRMKEKLGNKMPQKGQSINVGGKTIMFFEDNDVADDYKDFYPHVHIYEYGHESTGTLNDLYTLLSIPN